MWGGLEKVTDQVVKYSTFFGQLWYILVFVFRLIVVVTLGSAVYSDEQSNFDCDTKSPGCSNTCFNKFSRLTHLRFWGFQLLAVTFPAVLFHFFTLYITSQVQKIDATKNEVPKSNANGEANGLQIDKNQVWEEKKMEKRQKIVGHVKMKQVYIGNKMTEIPSTLAISIAYFVGTMLRLVLEAIFLYFSYLLFTYDQNPFCNRSVDNPIDCNVKSKWDFIWGTIPAVYVCFDEPNTPVGEACSQHLNLGFGIGREGFVPCWISRPWEKTLFLRYMNILSAICFVLCVLEILYIPLKAFWSRSYKRASLEHAKRMHRRREEYYARHQQLTNSNMYGMSSNAVPECTERAIGKCGVCALPLIIWLFIVISFNR